MSKPFPASLIPDNDAARLRTLHSYQIINTTPEPIFDEYVAWAAQLFNTPISMISLVDEIQVWFKAVVGAGGVTSLPRTDSMCSAAILQDDAVIVSDYKPESCELISPAVAQAIGLNFYAGSALQMPDGSRIGMLAVIGREARVPSEIEKQFLSRLAHLVSQTIELRLRYLGRQQTADWEAAQQELTEKLDDNSTLTRYLAARGTGINLDEEEVAQVVTQRLEQVAAVLATRLNQP